MKLNIETRVVNSSELSADTRQFEIQPGAKAFHMLLDGIYSDKPKAVAREAVQNAYDAHLEANVTAPVEVTLPTTFNKLFIVKDCGDGMSHEFMMNGYCQVTHSTKNVSNTSVGGLGIGRLSALAICDTYTICTCHDGEEHTYAVFLDDQRIPSITHVSSKQTVGRGTTVTIPVNDIYTFQRSAKKAFLYFPEGALLLGNEKPDHVKYLIKTEVFAVRTMEYRSSGLYSTERANIVMGPIAYPIDFDPLSTGQKKYSNLRACVGLDIFTGIGSVDVAPSREGLDYSRFSLRKLHTLLDIVAAGLNNHVDAYMAQGKTPLARAILRYDMYEQGLTAQGYTAGNEARSIHSFSNGPGVTFAFVKGPKTIYAGIGVSIRENMKKDGHITKNDLPLSERLKHVRIIELDMAHRTKGYVPPARLYELLRNSQWEGDAVVFVRYDTPEARDTTRTLYDGCTFECMSEYTSIYAGLKPTNDSTVVSADPYVNPREHPVLLNMFYGREEYPLDRFKANVFDRDSNIFWVPTKRGRAVRTDIMAGIIDMIDLNDYTVVPTSAGLTLIGIPVSHGPATKWAKQFAPNIDDMLMHIAMRVWKDPVWRKRLAMYVLLTELGYSYSEYDDRLFGFLAIYNSSAGQYTADNLADNVLFKKAHNSAKIIAGVQDNYGATKRTLTLLSMYSFVTLDSLATSEEDRTFICRRKEFLARYPLVQLTAEARSNRYNSLVPEALLHYIQMIEDTHND